MASERVIAPGQTYDTVSRDVAAIAFTHPLRGRWWLALAGALGLMGVMLATIVWLLWQGVGIWHNNNTVVWALDIVSYDWWVGIACGSLVVSAMLLLVGAEWRGAVNRIAETMALLATAAAGIYPILHLGRPWFFYWTLPYPNTFALWPQFRSPLVWDAFDILSLLVVSFSFWYTGMLPDLATLRDRAFERVQARPSEGRLLRAQLYGIAAFGWRGSATHWQRWMQAYRTIGILGVIAVVALQTGASVMFAGTVEPGWHDTLLPVAYLAGALLSGVAAVAMLTVVLRGAFALKPLITERHFDLLGLLLLTLGWINIYCYATEFLVTWLGGNSFDTATLARRLVGPEAWSTWMILGCALLPVQLFWVPALRRSPAMLFLVGVLVSAGIWGDHFMVIVATLQHDFMPAVARPYTIGVWEWAMFAGSAGLFLFLLLMFLRYLPVVSMHEIRRLATVAGARRG